MPEDTPNSSRLEGNPSESCATCLSFDYGLRRIGVAVGNETLQTARPLSVISNNNGTPDWAAITALMEQWQPAYLVLGWPLTQDGQEQPLCQHIRGFTKRLRTRFNVAVHLTDERFSSIAAAERIRQMRSTGQRQKRTQKGDVDSVAAAVILESWLTRECDSP